MTQLATRAASPLRAVAVTGSLLLLVAAGCSDEEDPDGPRMSTVRSGLAALFAGDHAAERDVAAGNCFAEELTAAVEVDRLVAAGVLDSSYAVVPELPRLPEDVARPWARAQLACTDFAAESARAQLAATRGAADAGAFAECLRTGLSDAQLEAALVETLTGTWDGPAVARLGEAQAACAGEPG